MSARAEISRPSSSTRPPESSDPASRSICSWTSKTPREVELAAGRLEGDVVSGALLAGAGMVAKVRRAQAVGLEDVDPAQQAGKQPGWVAADLVTAKRQLVEPVEQHRQPVGNRDDGEEGVEAGGGGMGPK